MKQYKMDFSYTEKTPEDELYSHPLGVEYIGEGMYLMPDGKVVHEDNM